MLTEPNTKINLEELRSQLAGRVATLLICISGLAMWMDLGNENFPTVVFCLWAGLLVVGLVTWRTNDRYPGLARHVLVWGLTSGLVAAMYLFADAWIPFLGLPLGFVSALLISRGELVTMGGVAFVAWWHTHISARAYPSPHLFIALVAGVVLAWLIVGALYTALQWAWSTRQRADELLELARDRQGELNRTLKSLELAHDLQRRTQRELYFARKRADEARRMKEQFAANISHELRTPLNLILGFSEVMYLSPEIYGAINWPPLLRRDIYHIYRSSCHLLDMIDDILDLSRFDMAEFTLNREPTPLEPLLRNTVEIAQDLFRAKPVELKLEIAADLPTLEVDRTRIRQVLLNVLNNAQRFTDEGRVRLEVRQVKDEVVISVSDTGPGIPADRLPHIFDEFYQVDYSLRRNHEGAGLGLAICKRFVQAHGGRIWVESQEGVGTTLFFTLPVPAHHMPVSSLLTTWPPEPSQIEDRPSILVVGDSSIAGLIGRHIEAYDVVQVNDLARLAEEIAVHHPQAVTINVYPGEQPEYGNALSIPVPFIECSLPSQSRMASNLEVVACLTKPISAESLLAEIGRLDKHDDILIIDDDRGFCHLVERILQTSGNSFDVRLAYDGEDGLSAMHTRRPDLLLLDLIMPGVDGFQVLETMRRDVCLVDVPVILLTATCRPSRHRAEVKKQSIATSCRELKAKPS
jgi:signal transduction histidine kinase/CheY-like chemotaxis protein